MKNESYLRRQRHLLLDMHIPDWNERFLSRFSPTGYVDLCVAAGADSVMFYCSSIAGRCNWPTKVGKMHDGLAGRDAVGEAVQALHKHGLAACAYYSAIYNNWAYTEHPEWRIVPSRPGGIAGSGSRHGVCCPNHPEYLEFMLRQTEELVSSYPFDAFFFDMLFWPDVCVCDSCRSRYRQEEGAEIPEVVDWYSSGWCRFQAARERWLADTFGQLRERVKESLDIPVFHNGAVTGVDWILGIGHDLVAQNDVLGGDFLDRSLFPAFARLTPTVTQYMHIVTGLCGSASQLKPIQEQKTHALTATTFGGQFMAIDTVESDGSVDPAAYDRLSEVFAAMRPYEAFLGGTPQADIAVYRSLSSDVSFRDNGTSLDQVHLVYERFQRPSPHGRAVQGAVGALSEAHLPTGVITRADLDKLDQFPVIALPNVARMDYEEIEAFRGYVERGGRLYASGVTSLVTVDGSRHEDFLLADVFGCHLVGEETAALIYLAPAVSEVEGWIAPLSYVPHGEPFAMFADTAPEVTALRIAEGDDTEVLATTTLPYREGRGTRDDEAWASALTSPPWEDTSRAAVVRRRFGDGVVIYSSADIEASCADPSGSEGLGVGSVSDSAKALFTGLVRSLLPRAPSFEVDAHPNVWATAFHEPEEGRMRLCFLNRPQQFPTLPIPTVAFRVTAPNGARFTGLNELPTGQPIPFSLDAEGTLRAEVHDLDMFEMVSAAFEQQGSADAK